MGKSERKDLICRMVAQARRLRASRKSFVWTKDEITAEARGMMKAARMLKGFATAARFKIPMRRAA